MASNVQEAGRGRKQCPKCQMYVGVRTTTCKCGHVFVSKTPETTINTLKSADTPTVPTPKSVAVVVDATPIKLSKSEEVQKLVDGSKILVPAGPCPFELSGTDYHVVWKWAKAVLASDNLSIEALCHYVKQFYDVNGEDFRVVVTHLHQMQVVNDDDSN